MDTIRFRPFLLALLSITSITVTTAQNLARNGSMDSREGEAVAAPQWTAPPGRLVNTPDINDDIGPLHCTAGYEWTDGAPAPSPDGGTWQNVFYIENFEQTITGLIPGQTYYFSYYYCTQGIRERSSNTSYIRAALPHVTITGATGYSDPVNAGTLYAWKRYQATIVATSTNVTINFSGTIDSYLAYDGIYLSPVPEDLPAITLEPQTQTACSNNDVFFKASATNADHFQWQVNTGSGWQDIGDDLVYLGTHTSTLIVHQAPAVNNGFRYQCIAANSCCHVTTQPATLFVTAASPPTISISTPSSEICAGTPVTFTALPFNGGSTPIYRWTQNGTQVGTNAASFTALAINDGDQISCELVSNSVCRTATSAISTPITMRVHPSVSPSITITASERNICKGTPVIFEAATSGGGPLPVFAWTKNGVDMANGTPEYSSDQLSDNDIIQCKLISSETCPLPAAMVLSNAITMQVKPSGHLNARISGSADLCEGSPAQFQATGDNGSTVVQYVWTKNGQIMQTGGVLYQEVHPSSGDRIRCELSSIDACVTTHASSSNEIVLNVHPAPIPDLGTNTKICEGGIRVLDAGPYESFLWNDGSKGRQLSVRDLGTYAVSVTDRFGCTGTGTIAITARNPAPRKFLPAQLTKCSYGTLEVKTSAIFEKYRWSTGDEQRSIAVKTPGVYGLEVTDRNGCIGKDSTEVAIKECRIGFFAPNAFTPNGDGHNDAFAPVVQGDVLKYELKIFNRWGQLVYHTTDCSTGWTGSQNGEQAGSGTYIWSCIYQFEHQAAQIQKGTVILLR